MPKWPAYVMGAAAAACALPAFTMPAPPAPERYAARGQEPGWMLEIENNRMNYRGDYGETQIVVARPEPRASVDGRRYETPRLIADIRYARCNDAMSGQGYAHRVTVIANGETHHGCGGEPRPEWDA